MKIGARVGLALAPYLFDHADSFRVAEASDDNAKQAEMKHLTHLGTAFDEFVEAKVTELCDEVVNKSKGWIEELERSSVREVAEDCNRVTGRCGTGCKKGTGTCKNAMCTCEDDSCAIHAHVVYGDKKRSCVKIDKVMVGLKEGSIDREDLEPENGFLRAIDAVAGMPEAIQKNVPAKCMGFVVRVASNKLFRKEVKDMAVAGIDEVCMTTSMRFKEESDPKISELASIIQEKLQQVLTAESTMLEDFMIFIFSPAELIPGIGPMLKTMLEAVAKWGAKYVQKKLKTWLVSFLDKLLEHLAARSSSNGLIQDVSKVLRCDTDPFDFESWEKSKFESLMNPKPEADEGESASENPSP